ncbi:MAG: transporter [Oceanospirillaceae bacterium]|nr:transporter [Oceanospirillaceae bacterium]|tara:strand:- start:1409 stop:2347 length:939 start_codon:yes stop_codon:yes gene_type:complete
MHLESLLFAVQVILPVCLLVSLGVLLKKLRIIDQHFIDVASSLVFKVTLPTLVFLAIAGMDSDLSKHIPLLIFVTVAILVSCILGYGWTKLTGVSDQDRSAFVQAAFRSNLGIIGIAMVVYAFGEEGTRYGALVLAIGVPMYNLLSVMVLANDQDVSLVGQAKLILTNPLIVAIVLALPFSLLAIKLPDVVLSAAHSLGSMTLPLALISIGGSLSLAEFRRANQVTLQIAFLKLIVFPGLVLCFGLLAGFEGIELGVMVIMLASPTAAAAFVMSRSMGGNATLTANAIAVTTLGSLITTGAYFYVLRFLSLV